MGISKLFQNLARLFRQQTVELDYMLDRWISDALMEDALAQPPQGA